MTNEKYRMKRMADLCVHKKQILDLGCAHQPNPYLKAEEVIGFDIEQAKLPDNYSKFIQGNVSTLCDFFEDDSLEVIHAGEILEHLEAPLDFLRNCHSLLTDRGFLVLSTPNPNSIWERFLTMTLSRRFMYAADHVCLYPQRWLIRMMELAGFTNIRLYSGGIQTPFGLVCFPRPWCYQTIAVGKKTTFIN